MAKSLLTNVRFSRVSLVDKGASFDTKTGDGAHVLLFKRETADGDNTMTLAEITKALATLSTEDKESLKKALGAPAAAEDILKGLSPAQRELVEKAQKDAELAKAEAKKNADAIAELQKAAHLTSLRKRVDVYASLSGDAEALAKILGCVETNMGTDVAMKFEETLKGWNEAIKKGALAGPVGSRGTQEPGASAGATAYDEAAQRAAGIVEKSAGKTSLAEAVMKVFEEDPALYARHRAETGTAR